MIINEIDKEGVVTGECVPDSYNFEREKTEKTELEETEKEEENG